MDQTRAAKRLRMDDVYPDVSVLPSSLPDGRAFRLLKCVDEARIEDDVVSARTRSVFTGQRFSRDAQDLQRECSKLPAARAVHRIRRAINEASVIIVRGATGSGKSTQVPQILLEMCRQGVVIHVCPLTEPLRGLHDRLVEEMDGRPYISLLTGSVTRHASQSTSRCSRLTLMTCGVLVKMWWDVMPDVVALVFDEAHIRSLAYSDLFQMVKPLLAESKIKLLVMSATLCLSGFSVSELRSLCLCLDVL